MICAGIRKKECIQKRRLGRNPRIPFSTEQVTVLEEKFQYSPYLNNMDVVDLSKCLQLSESRVSKYNITSNSRVRSCDKNHRGSFITRIAHSYGFVIAENFLRRLKFGSKTDALEKEEITKIRRRRD